MKLRFQIPLLLACVTTIAPAADQVLAYLAVKGEQIPAFINDANDKAIQYTEQKASLLNKQIALTSIDSIYFMEPASFKEAMELFQGRDYAKAKEKFVEAKEENKMVDQIPGNYSSLAGYYEMECARLMMDLETLNQLFGGYDSKHLLNETHLTQLDLYKYWEAVRTESWARLLAIAASERERKLPGSQRAQIAYCTGLALERSGKSTDALSAYNEAFTADFAGSQEISRAATLNCFRVISENENVQIARELFGTDDYAPNSQGAALLIEAAALVTFWDRALGAGEPLPDKLRAFSKYEKSKPSGAAAPSDKKADAPADKKADAPADK